MRITAQVHRLGAFKCLKQYYCTGWELGDDTKWCDLLTYRQTQPFIVKDEISYPQTTTFFSRGPLEASVKISVHKMVSVFRTNQMLKHTSIGTVSFYRKHHYYILFCQPWWRLNITSLYGCLMLSSSQKKPLTVGWYSLIMRWRTIIGRASKVIMESSTPALMITLRDSGITVGILMCSFCCYPYLLTRLVLVSKRVCWRNEVFCSKPMQWTNFAAKVKSKNHWLTQYCELRASHFSLTTKAYRDTW